MSESVAELASGARQAERADAREPAIVIEGLVRRYGEREALASVDAVVERDETLAVFGPNGAGKTTLLRVLATLLLPHSGAVRVLDCELPRQAHLLRARIGLLGHEPLLYRELSGIENLEFYTRLYGLDLEAGRHLRLLDAVGMAGRANDPVRDLSRGMVQRLAVCRAVLHRPELLLLDEPWANLDPDAAELVEPLIGRGCGCTRVLVTHDVERALAESDRVLGLHDGRVLISAPAADVDHARVRALYGRDRSSPR